MVLRYQSASVNNAKDFQAPAGRIPKIVVKIATFRNYKFVYRLSVGLWELRPQTLGAKRLGGRG